MAKVSRNNHNKSSNQAYRGQSRRRLAREDMDPPSLLDYSTKRKISGIVMILIACVLFLLVVWPTDAIVARFVSLVLKQGLGIGAYVLPFILICIALTFITTSERKLITFRSIIGFFLILIGLLILLALFTPDIVGPRSDPLGLFALDQIVIRGGYIGAGPAYIFVTLFGLPVAIVIAIGLMAIGLVTFGISIRPIIDVIVKRCQFDTEEEEDLGVVPAAPYAPYAPATRFRENHRSPKDSFMRTRKIGEIHPTGALTRRLRDPEDEPTMDESLFDNVKDFEKEREKQVKEKVAAAKKRREESKAQNEKEGLDSIVEERLKEKQHKNSHKYDEARFGLSEYKLPRFSLLNVSPPKKENKKLMEELDITAARLQQTLEDFGIMADVVDWISGPTVTLFQIDLPPGVRVSKITALQDDIALALAAPGVRIFAPIPHTHYVGIEVPNQHRENVLLGDVLKEVSGGPLELAIGKDVEGKCIICDLAKMPHLLIGGTTGSGKSVGINAMIMSMIMRATPAEVRFIMIDPKRVEFAPYDGIPHLYVPVVTEPKEAASALSWGVAEMERRLKLFSQVGVRNISSFNDKVLAGEIEGDVFSNQKKNDDNSVDEDNKDDKPLTMPYIVIIIDELADLMMNVGKEVEFSISRIAQLARAAGIHLIVATQRPSANVVTGLIKANITNRMAFNVASGLDSRVILDTAGAESLIGNGDVLLSKPEYAKPVRIQGCFTSDDEISSVVEFVKTQGEPEYHSEILKTNLVTLGDTAPDASSSRSTSDDPLIWEAAEIVTSNGSASTSNIQRKLKVGYSRAGRIMDMLEEKGIVGPPNGSKPREVLLDPLELETLKALEKAENESE